MRALSFIPAAIVVGTAVFVASVPAHALTSRQYAAQGDGYYTTSKGVPQGYARGFYPAGPVEYYEPVGRPYPQRPYPGYPGWFSGGYYGGYGYDD